MVDDAMANRPHKIDGREVETKRAVPRDVITEFYLKCFFLFITIIHHDLLYAYRI